MIMYINHDGEDDDVVDVDVGVVVDVEISLFPKEEATTTIKVISIKTIMIIPAIFMSANTNGLGGGGGGGGGGKKDIGVDGEFVLFI